MLLKGCKIQYDSSESLSSTIVSIIILLLVIMIISLSSLNFCRTPVLAVEDLERNNGHDKPYFMSKKLMKLLNAKNVKTDGTDGAVQMESLETVNA